MLYALESVQVLPVYTLILENRNLCLCLNRNVIILQSFMALFINRAWEVLCLFLSSFRYLIYFWLFLCEWGRNLLYAIQSVIDHFLQKIHI